jgi:uncharacterized protein YbjT (DUF2867 family)
MASPTVSAERIMILVVGATGVLGSEVCRRLRRRNLPVRALVRRGSAGEGALREIGAEISYGDLRAPATIDEACRGVRSVISTATAMGAKDKSLTLRAVDHDGQLHLVRAAKAAGVGQFIFVSVPPHLLSRAPLVRYKREVEAAVRSSGMRWTILQPTLFMEIWLSKQLGFDVQGGKATVVGDGNARLNFISVGDVAEHAVRSLDDARLFDREIQLGGPEPLTYTDVVRIFEQASGRAIRMKRVPPGVLAALVPVARLFNEMAASGMSMMSQTSVSENLDTTTQRQLALPLTSVQEYASRVATRST